MIFRKPYGFLIKNFKIIHLLLVGLFIYLVAGVNNILGYYNDFIVGNASKVDAMSYVTDFYVFPVVVSVVICIIIYALLQYKKKPRMLYLGLIAFLMVIVYIINLVYGGLEIIHSEVLNTKTLRLYRDMLRLLIPFQYVSIGVVLIRGLGFDIKKFDFVKDMHELNLDVSDDEEVELTLGSTNSLQRKFFRWWRELKYYYFENKIFIWIFIGILVLIGASTLYVREEIVNKVYQEGETFSSSEFSFNILETYITNKSYNNKVITKEDNSFVIIKMVVASNNERKKLNSGNLVLNVNYNSYTYDNYYGARFSDLGVAYKEQEVYDQKTYLFIYKVANEDINSDMTFVYAGDIKVNLSPVMLDEVGKSSKYKIGESINLDNTVLESGSFMISDCDINSSFPYSFQYEISGQTFTSQYSISSVKGGIMNLKITSSFNDLNNYSFLNTYATLNYKIGNEVKVAEFDDKTPGNYKDGLYLAVDDELMKADSIWFDIRIRNMGYIYTIK